MPAEIRHIVFCAAEVAAAVREYRRHLGRPLPSGALRRLELFPGTGGVRVSLEIAPDNGLDVRIGVQFPEQSRGGWGGAVDGRRRSGPDSVTLAG